MFALGGRCWGRKFCGLPPAKGDAGPLAGASFRNTNPADPMRSAAEARSADLRLRGDLDKVDRRSATVATCSYNQDMETGIRELKDNLSRYIRRIEAGERVVVTAHGRVVAELVPPAAERQRRTSPFDQLIASGVITPPGETGDPLEGCPKIGLAPGTAAALMDWDRDDG